MADEQTQAAARSPSVIPADYDWPQLLKRDGDELEVQYRHTLEALGREKGTAGRHLPQGAEQDPGPGQAAPADRRPDRPRAVDQPGHRCQGRRLRGPAGQERRGRQDRRRPVLHPAAAHPGHRRGHAPGAGDDDLRPRLRHRRLPAGGARLHRRPPPARPRPAAPPEVRGAPRLGDRGRHRPAVRDEHVPARHRRRRVSRSASPTACAADPGDRFDMVLTNPPFGKKSSFMVVNAEGETERENLVVVRDDFWASTSNKQLNFVQHVKTLLKINGRAAVVVPDNVLFEGGAGETVRRKLLARVRRPHPAAPADRHLLRPGRQGQRALLRSPRRRRAARRPRSCGSTTSARTSTSR